jgi:MFS family permease
MYNSIVIISSQIPRLFAPPPHLFDSKAIGLFTISSFIGVIVAHPLTGPLIDLLSRTLTKANNSIHKPEHRIPALILPFLLSSWGLILYAYTATDSEPHFAAAGLCFVPSVVLSYVVDAYPMEGGKESVLINAGKNLVAFGVTKGNAQWLAKEGLNKIYCDMAGIQWAVVLLGLPLYFAGPWLRRKTQSFV